MPTVAVVYLARVAHGIDAFKPFAESYLRHPAGYKHDLILLGKGMTKKGEHAATSALFGDAPHRIIEVSEDGYDIHAYLKAAMVLDHDYVLFCNTYTEFASDNWLAKMMEYAVKPDVGIVGASASYESIYSSTKLYHKLLWLAGNKLIHYDESIATQYSHFLQYHYPAWMGAHFSRKARIRRMVGDVLRQRPRYSAALDEEFEREWHNKTDVGGELHMMREFPRFPNPHIRSTVFLMSRERLVNFHFKVGSSKMDCAVFESGTDGLSARVQKRGLDLILVGADGKGYAVDEWPQSKTFRIGDQSNCLTNDNHISAFRNFDPANREVHARIAWGDYLPSSVPFQAVGESYPKVPVLVCAPSLPRSADSEDESISYSIVIPTHNRVALVKEAIETVRRQTYPNWELVVFDNASTEPLKEHVASLNDPRIRFKRSDKFLAVTDSWNNAIDLATGDYIMLIGDDDGLKPDFFQRLNRINFQFRKPDVIYSSILQFFHPGVAPWKREGYVTEIRNGFFFLGRDEPFMLDAGARRKAVENSLNIRRGFTFNMQAFVFKREFLDKMRMDGKVFQSPFPDYYLANVAFAIADTVVAVPESLAIAGVSRASFGFTLFNKLEKKGAELLKTDFDADLAYQEMKGSLLPGPAYNSSYIMTMLHVCKRLGNWTKITPNLDRYRKMQLLALMPEETNGMAWTKTEAGSVAWSKTTAGEKLWAVRMSMSPRTEDSYFTKQKKGLDPTWFAPIAIAKNEGDFASTLDLFDAIERHELEVKDEPTERRTKLRRPIRTTRTKFRRVA